MAQLNGVHSVVTAATIRATLLFGFAAHLGKAFNGWCRMQLSAEQSVPVL